MLHRLLRCEFGGFIGYCQGARNRKICGNCRFSSGRSRSAALAISGLVRLVGALARGYFHREGKFQILLSTRYLHSHQHCAHDSWLDSPAVNDRVQGLSVVSDLYHAA
jgi:hypothetical protein